MQNTTKTKVCYSETNAEGKTKQYITSETAWNKIVKDAGEAKEQPPDLVSTGTFGYSFATSVDEAVALAGGAGSGSYENIDVFLGVFNYAAGLRQDNEANDILQSDNFEAWEGSKDVAYAVAQKQERSKMTHEEKALKELAKVGFAISADQLRAALELIKQQSAPQVAG
jgi:hypothetical protein